MQSLKIAVVVGTFPVISQTFIVNQINALIDSGHEVSLYAYKKGQLEHVHDSLKTHDLIHKVKYLKKNNPNHIIRFLEFKFWTLKNLFKIRWKRYFKALNFFKYGNEAYLLSIFFALEWSLIEDDFDIIHIHFAHNAKLISYLKSLGLFHPKTKLVTTLHGYDLIPSKADFYKDNYGVIFKETDAFTVNSLFLKNELLKLQPQLKNIDILPVGVDSTYFTRTQSRSNKSTFDILFCGRLIALKGVTLAIDIIKCLVHKGHKQVRLHIIGDGPLFASLDAKIKKENLESFVLLKGAMSQEAIKGQLEMGDIFLMPGIADPQTGQVEAQGLVIQEAQAMELPVIVSDVGGMKYGLIQNETGFVVEANNIEAFVSSVESLINNEVLRLKMGKKGAEFVRENYDNNVLNKKLEERYYQLISTSALSKS